MSIYSELLRLALEDDHAPEVDQCSIEELVDVLVERRLHLERSREELAPSAARAAEWTADLITHDVALVRLCQRIGVKQRLTDPSAPPTERDRLLSELAAKWIGLGQGAIVPGE